MNKYKPGDIVALKSGSQAMTVFQVEKTTECDIVTAAWMFNGGCSVMKFPAAALVYHGHPGIVEDFPGSVNGIID